MIIKKSETLVSGFFWYKRQNNLKKMVKYSIIMCMIGGGEV